MPCPTICTCQEYSHSQMQYQINECALYLIKLPHGVGAPNQNKNDHLAMLGPVQLSGHRLHFHPFIPPSIHYELKLNCLIGCEGGKDSTYNFVLIAIVWFGIKYYLFRSI